MDSVQFAFEFPINAQKPAVQLFPAYILFITIPEISGNKGTGHFWVPARFYWTWIEFKEKEERSGVTADGEFMVLRAQDSWMEKASLVFCGLIFTLSW